MKQYYYQKNGKSYGPLSVDDIKTLGLSDETYIWYDGLDAWIPISESPDFKRCYTKENKRKFPIIIILCIITMGILVVISGIIRQSARNYDKNKYIEYPSYSIDPVDARIIANSYTDINEDFSMYVDKFYRDLDFYGHRPLKPSKVIIKFSDMDRISNATHLNGVSYGYNDDSKIEIYINRSYWNKATKAQKYWLMYHELAHDILNIDDLPYTPDNVGKLMCESMPNNWPEDMDDFIEAYHDLFLSLFDA